MSLLSSVLADSINDVSSTRKVYLLAAGLALMGIALIAVTVWFWRNSRHDPQLLAPLEVMGGKKFRTLDGSTQRHVLDEARPEGAEPMRWGVRRGEAIAQPEIDLAAIHREEHRGYDDLRDPAIEPVAAESAVAEAAVAESIVVESFVAATALSEPGDDSIVQAAPADDGALAADNAAEFVVTDEQPAPAEAEAAPGNDAASEESPPEPPGADIDEPALVELEQPSLVIVPLDHDLAASADDRADLHRPAQAPAVAVDDEHDEHGDADEHASGPSIDPLLRMFNRNDS